MQFVDLELSRRLESAEGHAASQYAATRQRLFPESGAEWMHSSGAFVVFDGIESPVTQTFGLGIFEEIRAEGLDEIERFFPFSAAGNNSARGSAGLGVSADGRYRLW